MMLSNNIFQFSRGQNLLHTLMSKIFYFHCEAILPSNIFQHWISKYVHKSEISIQYVHQKLILHKIFGVFWFSASVFITTIVFGSKGITLLVA